jgi:hypothetical protein
MNVKIVAKSLDMNGKYFSQFGLYRVNLLLTAPDKRKLKNGLTGQADTRGLTRTTTEC